MWLLFCTCRFFFCGEASRLCSSFTHETLPECWFKATLSHLWTVSKKIIHNSISFHLSFPHIVWQGEAEHQRPRTPPLPPRSASSTSRPLRMGWERGTVSIPGCTCWIIYEKWGNTHWLSPSKNCLKKTDLSFKTESVLEKQGRMIQRTSRSVTQVFLMFFFSHSLEYNGLFFSFVKIPACYLYAVSSINICLVCFVV